MCTIQVSFLSHQFPTAYAEFKSQKVAAKVYTIVLAVAVVLSLFLYNGFIKFFIDLMLGWTVFFALYLVVIVVSLDRQVEIQVSELDLPRVDKPLDLNRLKVPESYGQTKIRGIALCVCAVIVMYFSNVYKKFYAFQCQELYLEATTGVYHLYDDCKYIGRIGDDEYVDDIRVLDVIGADIRCSNYTLCPACKEEAESYDIDVSEWMYRRR
jgi:hypothetical protein